MDVHIGREAVTSWKDFAVRYLLIALSILSAWGVNQWNEARQHRNSAETARVALNAELNNNLREVRDALAFSRDAIERGRPFRQQLVAALKSHMPEAQIERDIIGSWLPDLQDSYPTLRRDAWEAAVAGQAVMYLPPAELLRYSAAYAAMRDMQTLGLARISGSVGELTRRFVDWELNRRIGRLDAAELARLLVLWSTLAQAGAAQLRELDEALSTALQVPPLPPPAAASAASR